MVLNFYGKILLACLLGFSIFSCNKEEPMASRTVKPPTKEIPPLQTEDDTDQGQEEGPLSKTKAPQDEHSVSTPKTVDSIAPDPLEKTEESGSMSDDDGVLSPATGRTEEVGTTSDLEGGVMVDTPVIGSTEEAVPALERGVMVDTPVIGSTEEAAPALEGGVMVDTSEKEGEKIPQKSVNFPQEENWRFTFNEVANFDFIPKRGSDVFYYYIQFWLNQIKNPPPQLDESKIQFLIKNLSSKRILFVKNETQEGEKDSLLFLQGQMAPKDFKQIQRRQENGEIVRSPHVRRLSQQLEKMEQKGAKKIVVNLPHQLHKDPDPFTLLGTFIEQQEIDLHIVGGCEHYCATYLLPAARTVYMEPYGYIYKKGISWGLLQEITSVRKTQKQKLIEEFRKEWLSKMTREEKIFFVALAINQPELQDLFLNLWAGEARPEQALEIQEKIKKFQTQFNKLSISDWKLEELKIFAGDFSPLALENIALFFKFYTNDRASSISFYVRHLNQLAGININYLAGMKGFVSQQSYNYIKLNILFDFLLKDEEYAEYFSVPRNFYNIPEKDKPYKWIIPSAGLLKSAGINIRGENNMEMMDLSYMSSLLGSDKAVTAEQFLYMDSERIENCNFFENGAGAYTTETLQNCLLKSALPQKFLSFQKQERVLLNAEKSPVSEPIENPSTGRAEEVETATEGGVMAEAPVAAAGGAGVETVQIDPMEGRDEKTFPVNEEWKITGQQVMDFDFIKQGRSNVFNYSIQFLFNEIEYLLKGVDPEGDYAKKLSGLCYESDCSKGLNPKRVAQQGMPSVIRLFSFLRSQSVEANDPPEEPLIFFQGQWALSGWDSWLYIKKRRKIEDLPPYKGMLGIIKWMEQNDVKKIAVNLPPQPYEDPQLFYILGGFIKRKQIDLHIVGGCGHYCAAHLLPAAKTVYIEPYGYIYHKGSFKGLSKGVEKIWTAQGEKYMREIVEQWLPNLTKEEMTDFIAEKITTSTNAETAIDNLINALKEDNTEWGNILQENINRFEFQKEKDFFQAAKKEIKESIQSLSEDLLKKMTLLLRSTDDDERILSVGDYRERLKYFSQSEDRYYSAINIQGLPSKKQYSYADFLMLSAFLLKDTRYAESFSVPRAFYNIPEKDKPYEWVVPSAELLRNLGMDVRGENNREMIDDPEFLSLLGLSKENMLYLDGKGIENCGFFEEGASAWTTEKINECLISNN